MKTLGNALILLLAGATFSSVTRAATPPTTQNTALTMSFDRASIPSRVIIWDQLSTGYDEAAVGKWERNTLVCQSKTDAKYGACLTVPYWYQGIGLTKIELNFTLVGTSTVASIVVEGRKYHGPRVTGSAEATLPLTNKEGRFTFSIPQAELKKLNRTGTWTATLKQKLMQWPYGIPCTGDPSNPDVGCTNAVELNTWAAKMTLNVTDYGNQQIFLPAFPTSVASINLNLKIRPETGGGKNVSGSTSLDMCLYDGNNSASNRISLILQDEGGTAEGRLAGQFSIYRRGGDKSKTRDRLDYQVSVVNPATGAMQNVANGTEITWSDTNRRNIQRQVILPGVSMPALCVPAPLTLTTPAFSLSDKTAGDYTGTLRIIYTPTTQTAQ
ncbi:CfaE/CblD family pilus tip adhesin [Serratia fonticola]|uniref:CfaE/CblD family pilus tip adhesin n=1 Tax=Serratia fonticola TaxID=47917 RepID=UPI00211C677B|nr:CfaE/CblD family pilus tip adhesin [Serratia fonticola]